MHHRDPARALPHLLHSNVPFHRAGITNFKVRAAATRRAVAPSPAVTRQCTAAVKQCTPGSISSASVRLTRHSSTAAPACSGSRGLDPDLVAAGAWRRSHASVSTRLVREASVSGTSSSRTAAAHPPHNSVHSVHVSPCACPRHPVPHAADNDSQSQQIPPPPTLPHSTPGSNGSASCKEAAKLQQGAV
jgi:hypothetical protein